MAIWKSQLLLEKFDFKSTQMRFCFYHLTNDLQNFVAKRKNSGSDFPQQTINLANCSEHNLHHGGCANLRYSR